jgi:hypothetical protein
MATDRTESVNERKAPGIRATWSTGLSIPSIAYQRTPYAFCSVLCKHRNYRQGSLVVWNSVKRKFGDITNVKVLVIRYSLHFNYRTEALHVH